MLVATELARKMKESVSAATEGQELSKLGQAIAQYISANAVVTFSWTGFSSPPSSTPDPTVVFYPSSIKCQISLTPTGTTNPTLSMLHLGTQIQTGISSAIILPAEGFVLPTINFLATSPCPFAPTGIADQEISLNLFANTIITWLKTCINPAPFPGSHWGAYSGTARMVSIL